VRIEIDRERCMGSGNCTYWAPEVFDIDDDMVAVVIGDPAAHEERVQLAVDHCPTRAISLADSTVGGDAFSAARRDAQP
jgi:ferredoxin